MTDIKNLMMGGFDYVKNYGLRFLFQTTFGTSKTNLVNNIQLSQMNSSSVQKQLKAAGIDTNSKKYKVPFSFKNSFFASSNISSRLLSLIEMIFL